MKKPLRIFIADDNRLLRDGLASMFADIEDINVAGGSAIRTREKAAE